MTQPANQDKPLKDTTPENAQEQNQPEVAKVEKEVKPENQKVEQGAFQNHSRVRNADTPSGSSDTTLRSSGTDAPAVPTPEQPDAPVEGYRGRNVVEVPGPARTGNGNDRPHSENMVR